MEARHFESILITGASGGLGGALARQYAAPGVRLALGGRDLLRLQAVAEACRGAGAEVSLAAIDVTDPVRMREWTGTEDAQRPIDLVIACAGVSGETGYPGEDPDHARLIYQVNVLGVLNTVEPLLGPMRARRRGQVGLIASVAGMRGMARGPAYSGSKAALITHGQGWREALAADGVGVSVACPGYIRTAMTTRHGFRQPFAVEPERAAAKIVRGLARNRARIVFPWPMALAGWMFRALPGDLTRVMIPGPRVHQP